MPADSIVKARIDTETKERAAAALGAMGLSISDAHPLTHASRGGRAAAAVRCASPERRQPSGHEGIERGPWASFGVGRGSIQGFGHLMCYASLVRQVQARCKAGRETRQEHR